jgi:hypothetical protein
MHDDDDLLSHLAYVEMNDDAEEDGHDQTIIWDHIRKEVQLLNRTDPATFGKDVCQLFVEVMVCLDELLMSEDVHNYLTRTCPSINSNEGMAYIYDKVRESRQSTSAQEFDKWCEKYATRQLDDDEDADEGEDEGEEDEGEEEEEEEDRSMDSK